MAVQVDASLVPSSERRIAMAINLTSRCPRGCPPGTLAAFENGDILCEYAECPDPRTVMKLLADTETAHIVQLELESFSARHPLYERVETSTLNCGLVEWLTRAAGPPVPPGRYRVTPSSEGGYIWNPAPEVD